MLQINSPTVRRRFSCEALFYLHGLGTDPTPCFVFSRTMEGWRPTPTNKYVPIPFSVSKKKSIMLICYFVYIITALPLDSRGGNGINTFSIIRLSGLGMTEISLIRQRYIKRIRYYHWTLASELEGIFSPSYSRWEKQTHENQNSYLLEMFLKVDGLGSSLVSSLLC